MLFSRIKGQLTGRKGKFILAAVLAKILLTGVFFVLSKSAIEAPDRTKRGTK